jgi:hypothetical protein
MRQTPSKPDPLWLALGVALLLVGPACAQAGPESPPELPTLADDAPAGSGMMQPCLEELCVRNRIRRLSLFGSVLKGTAGPQKGETVRSRSSASAPSTGRLACS